MRDVFSGQVVVFPVFPKSRDGLLSGILSSKQKPLDFTLALMRQKEGPTSTVPGKIADLLGYLKRCY